MPEHESIYKTILHTLPDFFFELDRESCFAYVNNSSTFFGFASDELISLHFSAILHPDDYLIVEKYIVNAAVPKNEPKPFAENLHFRRKIDSRLEYYAAQLCLYPIYENGVYRGAIGLLRNPSINDGSAQAMVLAEKHYRALLANSGELILIVTIDGTILFASESSVRLLGYHPFDLTGESLSGYLAGDDSSLFFSALEKCGSGNILLRFKKKKGVIAYMNSRIQLVSDAEGNNVCAIINSLNVGKIIRAERMLRRTEERYRDLIDSAAVGILTIDMNTGAIIGANSYILNLLGADQKLDDTSFLDFFLNHNEKEEFIRLIEGQHKICNYEVDLKSIEGRPLRILLNARITAEENIALSAIDLTGLRTSDNEAFRIQRHDALTSLPNRVYFEEYLQQKLNQEKIFALLCIGIDRFKQINDQFGHSSGDVMLRKLADRIKNVYFSKDLVSRFESDRFMILISDLGNPHDGIDYDIIELLSRKTKEIFSLPFVIEASEVRLQASVGICFYPFDGVDSEVLINRTELSMFMAKERGGNTFSYYDDRVNTDMLQRYQMEKELFEAHASREFLLYYQPLVNAGGSTVAYEALLRWKNRRGEFIPPSLFIPIAEKNSLIVEIGYFVFERACEDLSAINEVTPEARMNINISPVQFSQYDFMDNIRHIMHLSAVPISNIEIEITETALFDNMDIAVEKLHQFAKMGFSISIDDFGTGYSSLAKLKTFPLKSLKIDKSFVDDVIENPASATLVRTMIDLAHNLGCEVIAEGVETEEQFLYLKAIGCDLFQGYFFSKPVPLDIILKSLGK